MCTRDRGTQFYCRCGRDTGRHPGRGRPCTEARRLKEADPTWRNSPAHPLRESTLPDHVGQKTCGTCAEAAQAAAEQAANEQRERANERRERDREADQIRRQRREERENEENEQRERDREADQTRRRRRAERENEDRRRRDQNYMFPRTAGGRDLFR